MFEDCVVLRSYRKWQRIYRHELHASVNNSRDSSFYALSCVHAVEEIRPKLAPNMVTMKLVIVLLITSADAKRKHKGRKDDDHEDENREPVPSHAHHHHNDSSSAPNSSDAWFHSILCLSVSLSFFIWYVSSCGAQLPTWHLGGTRVLFSFLVYGFQVNYTYQKRNTLLFSRHFQLNYLHYIPRE